jgi:hypothetical protein
LDPTKHPENFDYFGDTTYITIPTRTLPIVRPFLELAAATGTTALIKPIVDLISPALRVLINTGYDSNLSPGIPAPFRLIPIFNPVKLAFDLVAAVGEGITAAVNDLGGTTVAPQTTVPAPLAAKAVAATATGSDSRRTTPTEATVAATAPADTTADTPPGATGTAVTPDANPADDTVASSDYTGTITKKPVRQRVRGQIWSANDEAPTSSTSPETATPDTTGGTIATDTDEADDRDGTAAATSAGPSTGSDASGRDDTSTGGTPAGGSSSAGDKAA